MLKEGDKAPEIQLETDTGEPFKLSAQKGKKVVLYFYPRADTPGCTVEACEFRDQSKKFTKNDAVIVGISPDAAKSQAKFKDTLSRSWQRCNTYAAAGLGWRQNRSLHGYRDRIARRVVLRDRDCHVARR